MTSFRPGKHHRRSIRLRGYDYTMAGAYFVTICTQDRQCLFGDVTDGVMQLNDAGRIVADTWQWLADQYPYVELDEWVVMPNHLHGIILMTDDRRGGSRTAPLRTAPLRTAPTVWQRNYYEHIVRDEKSLMRIRDYIVNNPQHWSFDRDNPAAVAPEEKNVWRS